MRMPRSLSMRVVSRYAMPRRRAEAPLITMVFAAAAAIDAPLYEDRHMAET